MISRTVILSYRSFLLAVALMCVPVMLNGQQPTAADVQLARVVIGGGAVIAGGSARTVSTIGQPFVGLVQTGGARAALGFWPGISGVPVGIDIPSLISAAALRLTAYPNPFSRRATLDLATELESEVFANVYDISGRPVVRITCPRRLPAGRHTLTWDGCDEAGRLCVPGAYYIRVEVRPLGGENVQAAVQPLLLLR